MHGSEPAISLHRVSKRFGERAAVDGLDLAREGRAVRAPLAHARALMRRRLSS